MKKKSEDLTGKHENKRKFKKQIKEIEKIMKIWT